MLIGELAKATNSTKDTIRHYDALGLLVSVQKQAGSRQYKDYSQDNIERIELIRLAKELGFTLSQMAKQIEAYYSGDLTLEGQISLLEKRKQDVEAKIEEMNKMHRYLEYKIALLRSKNETLSADACLALRDQI